MNILIDDVLWKLGEVARSQRPEKVEKHAKKDKKLEKAKMKIRTGALNCIRAPAALPPFENMRKERETSRNIKGTVLVESSYKDCELLK